MIPPFMNQFKQSTNNEDSVVIDLSFNIDTNFKLPIQYLDNNKLFAIKDELLYDLELKIPSNYNNDNTMYDHLFLPNNEFANYTINLWQQQYTNDIEYLNDTKVVINNINKHNETLRDCKYKINCNNIKTIWKNVKLDNNFLEKYNYMDWSILKSFNESSSFLQALSFIHVISPLISFILPFIFLIFPFIILKIQGIPINVSIYVETLKNIAKSHFIGKAITSIQTLNWQNLIYIMFIFGMYIFQIYQNIMLCKRFYNNSIIMNEQLIELRDYVDYTINSMESFVNITDNCNTYNMFNHINKEKLQILYEINEQFRY